jgi:hypothetical protein
MAKLIIEVLNRLGHCTERHHFEHFPVSIGRGYHNDLIIADPHVSPDHIIVHEDEQGWRVEDCDSLNGAQLKHHAATNQQNHISSGDDVIIGHSRLRFYSPEHPVAETHLLAGNQPLVKLIGNPLTSIGILLVTLAILLVNQQLVTNRIMGFEKLLASVLPSIIGAMFWAGIWAFTGRVIRHHANYFTQFSVSILFVLVLVLINNIIEYITFITSSGIIAQSIGYLMMGMAMFGLLYMNIANATAMSRKARLYTSHATTWGLLLFILFMDYAGQPDFTYSPSFPSTLKPPFAKLAHSQSVENYLKDSEKIFQINNGK